MNRETGLSGQQLWRAAITVWMGIAAVSIEGLGVNVMLPAISAEFRISAATSTLLVIAYQFGILLALLPLSALGEVVGYRRINQLGLAIYAAGGVICVLSTGFHLLVFARLMQGLGMSGVVAVNSALLRHIFPSDRLARAFSYNALLIGLFGAAGPTIVSAMIALGSWRWVYAVGVIICLGALLLGRGALPDNAKSRCYHWRQALLYGCTVALIFAGGLIGRTRAGALAALAFVAAAMAGMRLFVESARTARPLLPIDLLRAPIFLISLITSITCFNAQALAFVSLPFFLVHVLHRPAIEIGALLMSWPIALAVAAPLAGRLAGRVPTAILAGCGLLVMSLGLMLVARLDAGASNAEIITRLSLCGFGFGFFQTPNNHLLLTSVPIERAGGAAGLQAIARTIGQICGASLAALLFAVAPDRNHLALLLAGISSLLAAGLSFSRRAIRG